jgi:outer membrane biosynthesis protein TonB
VLGREPEPARPAAATPPTRPRPEPPAAPLSPEPRPEPAPAEVTAAPASDDEKIRRMEELLAQQRRVRPLGEMPDQPLQALPWGGGPEGDIQFESRADVDWGPYAARLRSIVRANWRIPTAAQVGMDGIVQVHFAIRRDGGIEELALVRESGTGSLDVAANDAIALSDKLPPPPLPADGPEDQVGVTWTFFYNIDEREYRLWRREERLRGRRQ